MTRSSTLLCAIQAHPSRNARARSLALRLATRHVVYDPRPDGPPDSWRCYRAVLESALHLPWWTSLLVVQDDAEPHPEALAAARLIARCRPLEVIALYVGEQNPQHARDQAAACARGDAYVQLQPGSWVPLVATIWPRPDAASLLATGRNLAYPAADDAVAQGWFARNPGRRCWATVPSLFDHDGEEPSLFGNSPGRRAAMTFGDSSPLHDVDWDLGRWV